MVNRPNRGERDKGRSNGFKYVAPSAADVKKVAMAKGNRFDTIFKPGYDIWKAKEGENAIRVLPPTWGDGYVHWGLEVWVHKNVGADNSTYLCLWKMKQKRCPICDAAKRMKAEGDADDAKTIDVTSQYVAWILDRDDTDKKPQLYPFSWTMNRDVMALTYNSRTQAVLVIAAPDDGYDVIIHRVGTKLNTKYTPAIDREKSPICGKEKDQDEILEYITENPVPDTLLFRDATYLENVVNGAVESGDEEDAGKEADSDNEEREARTSRRKPREETDDGAEADERPSRRRGRDAEEEEEPPRRGRSGREEPEEDGDAEGSPEEPEEEERPARGRRRDAEEEEERPARRRSRREEEEDDGRGQEEEEEEEEEPRRGSRRTRDPEPEEEEQPRGRRRVRDEEEEEQPEERGRRTQREVAPKGGGIARKTLKKQEEEEPAPRRRSRHEEEEDPPRRRR